VDRGNWVAIDKGLTAALPRKGSYTVIEAVFSYQVDIDQGITKSMRDYSRIWGWSRRKVENFLHRSQVAPTNVATKKPIKFRIINKITAVRSQEEAIKEPDRSHKGATTIILNPNPNPKEIIYSDFWKLYPSRNGKKIGKGEAEKLFNKLSSAEQKQVIVATKNYADSTKFPVDPIRFFKSKEYPCGLWREWNEGGNNGNSKNSDREHNEPNESEYAGLGTVVRNDG